MSQGNGRKPVTKEVKTTVGHCGQPAVRRVFALEVSPKQRQVLDDLKAWYAQSAKPEALRGRVVGN